MISYRLAAGGKGYSSDMQLTPEERKRRSELAKRLHAEGRFGGAGRGQGRPRQRRASEVAAERVAQEANILVDRMMEIVKNGGFAVSRQAIMDLFKLEEQERLTSVKESEKIDDLKRDELLELVTTQLRALSASGVLPDVIDGQAVLVDDAAIDGPRQIAASAEQTD